MTSFSTLVQWQPVHPYHNIHESIWLYIQARSYESCFFGFNPFLWVFAIVGINSSGVSMVAGGFPGEVCLPCPFKVVENLSPIYPGLLYFCDFVYSLVIHNFPT